MAAKDPTENAANALFGGPTGPEAAREVTEWPERVGEGSRKRIVTVAEPEDIDHVRGAWVWMDDYQDDLVVESLLAGAERLVLPLHAQAILEEDEAFEVEDFLFADNGRLMDSSGVVRYEANGAAWVHVPSDEEE